MLTLFLETKQEYRLFSIIESFREVGISIMPFEDFDSTQMVLTSMKRMTPTDTLNAANIAYKYDLQIDWINGRIKDI